MQNQNPYLPILEDQIRRWEKELDTRMREVAWAPARGFGFDSEPKARTQSHDFIPVSLDITPAAERLSLVKSVERLSVGDTLMSETVLHVLRTVRRGFATGLHLSEEYAKSVDLERLMQLNADKTKRLPKGEEAAFHAKLAVSSAVRLYVAASYIVWKLRSYRESEVSMITMELKRGIPETYLAAPSEAIRCALYYYVAYIEKSGVVTSELTLLKLTLIYFEALMREVEIRIGELQYKDPFTQNHYKLETEEFVVNGFQVANSGVRVIGSEFKRVEERMIVGNKWAKFNAKRLVQRLLAYDFERQRNPYLDLLEFFPWIRAGFGLPGTGKGMQIGYTATLLADYCKDLGYSFLFWPLPRGVISQFQGTSATNMEEYMRVIFDPTKIVYAPFDDAESIFQDRTRQGVSEGDRRVMEVFLVMTEGASAIVRGQSVIEFFTNLPEVIDPAILSRILERYEIDGAITAHDFIDQEYLAFERISKVDEKFIDLLPPSQYVYLSDQELPQTMSKLYEDVPCSSIPEVERIIEEVSLKFNPRKHAEFYGHFYQRLKRQFPFFTSRDVRNVDSAIQSRIMDFDMPQEYWNDPQLFFAKEVNYEAKRKVLIDLMKANMGTFSFADVKFQETIRYVDTNITIKDRARERRIDEIIEQIEIEREVGKRMAVQNGQIIESES